MTLPEGFSLRSASDEDAARAAQLVNEEARVQLGTPIWSTDQVLRHWSNPVVDRERDVVVVEAPGGVVCAWFSLVCGPPHVEVFALGVVGLAWHGRGVGSWILAETERRAHRFLELAPAGARVVIHAGALADEPAVEALLVAAGYHEIRRFQLMRVDFADVPPAPNVPAGIRIDQFDPVLDMDAAFEAHHEAFADHWGETEETPEEFRHWLIDTPRFDRELSLLARDGPVVAGYVFATPARLSRYRTRALAAPTFAGAYRLQGGSKVPRFVPSTRSARRRQVPCLGYIRSRAGRRPRSSSGAVVADRVVRVLGATARTGVRCATRQAGGLVAHLPAVRLPRRG
jgi:hypothetical protein